MRRVLDWPVLMLFLDVANPQLDKRSNRVSLEKFVRRATPVALSVVLAACGGGGSVGSSNEEVEPEAGAAIGEAEGTDNASAQNPASTVSGRVADGYIQGAIVCVDLNENDSCDTNEPSTVTGDGGTYNLDIPAEAQEKPIVADIPAEAIDEDTGEAVGEPLVFITPADKPEFLSPITTLIHHELRANPALNSDDAEQTVKSMLGIDAEDVSLFSDYVAEGKNSSGNAEKAEKFRYLHDTARVVASMMKDIETQMQTAVEFNSVDVDGSEDTQRAIREIVRSEVRELLPEIARQVAEIVRVGETSGQGSVEPAAEFNPDLLAQNLRPADVGESVQERVDAVRDRVDVVKSDIRQLLTDGVYWVEFDCEYDFENEVSRTVEDESTADEYDEIAAAGRGDTGDSNNPMPECEARYGLVQLNDSGDSLVTENYQYDGDTGGWVADLDEDDFHMANYSLVDGQWALVQSAGPEGLVEFTEDGTAVVTNEEGQMHLKAVSQEIGGTRVINHFWQDGANPLWFGLVESTDMFSTGSLAHKISVRQSSHPFVLFNHRPQDDQSREFCAQFNDNCNVVNAFLDGQTHAVTTLDEIRESATMGLDSVAYTAGFGSDGLMKLSAEIPEDGTYPTKGRVHWKVGFDGNDHDSGAMPVVGTDPSVTGVDPYSTYPAGNDTFVECHSESYPDATSNPDLPDSGVVEVSGLPEKTDCADFIAQTGTGAADADTEYPEQPSTTEAENHLADAGEEGRTLSSEWKLIEIDGVRMIEIQLPLIFRQDTDNQEAILLVEHDGFVRLGARLPESFMERVITYNETAFSKLLSIVETGIDSKQ